MPLTNNAIAQIIFETLRDSEEIFDACELLFSKPHLVALGLSGEDSPEPGSCPVFEVISWGKEAGDAPDNWPFAFSINVFIYDEAKEYKTTTTGVRTIVNRGPQSLEIILDLAKTAVLAALSNLDFDDCSFTYDEITFFPLFAGAINLTISFPKLGGGYLPTL